MLSRLIVALLVSTGMIAAGAQPHSIAATRFYKKVADCIGPFWLANMNEHGKHIAVGTVRVGFTLARDGRLIETHVMSNTSDRLAAEIAVDAIKRARYPAVPTPLLTGGMYRTDFTFTVFPNDAKRSNQSLQPTTDRRENLRMITSTSKSAAKLAAISGG